MAVGIGAVTQLPDRVVIRDDESLEAPSCAARRAAPLFAWDGTPSISFRRPSADRTVSGGHRGKGGGSLPGRVPKRSRWQFLAGLRCPCPANCFKVAITRFLSLKVASPWNPVPRRFQPVFRQVLTVVSSTPQRGSRATSTHGRQRRCVPRARPHGGSWRRGAQRDRLKVPEANGLGEVRGVPRCVSVQAFLMEHDRDSQAAVLEEELLNGIGQFSHPACRLSLPRFSRRAAGVTRSPDLPQAVAFFESDLRLGKVELARRIHQLLRLFCQTQTICAASPRDIGAADL